MGLRRENRQRNNSMLETRSVFLQLYEKGKSKAEKSLQSSKQAQRATEQKEFEKCTFKPDLSKTQTFTDKYMKKWKEPELKKASKRALRKFVNYPKGKENA